MNKKYFFLLLLLIPLLIIPQNQAYAVNTVTNIIKIEVSLAGGVQNEDFILPESVSNMNKTMIFLSARHIGDSNEKEVYRSWELINSTAIRFYGSSNVPANNEAISFTGYIVEFSNTSDMFSQTDSFTVAGGLSDQEFTDLFGTAVNTTSSFFQFMGQTANHADLTWGREELARMRIINSTGFGYEPFDAPNSGDTIVRYQIIDLNDPNVLVQRGNLTLLEGTELSTVTPPTAINGSRTLLFASHNTNGELDAHVDETQFTARIDGSNNLEFDRDDALCGVPLCDLQIRWEAITFLDGSVYVQYLEFNDTIATGGNVQQTGVVNFTSTPVNASRSIAIGTVHTPLGLGQGRTATSLSGSFDRLTYTVELIDDDTVDVITNDGASITDIWFQVVEFIGVSDAFSQSLQDTADVSDTVSRATDKVLQDTSDISDTIQLNANPNVTSDLNITDTITFATNKTVQSNATIADTIALTTNKFLQSIANITDTIIVTLTTGLFDQTTITDTINFTTIKILQSDIDISDTTSLGTNIPLQSDVNVTDTVTTTLLPSPPVPATPPTGGSGGGGKPTPPPLSTQLTGIAVSEPVHTLSTEIIVNPFLLARAETGNIEINWDQNEPIQIEKIEIPAKFDGFLEFEKEGKFEFKGIPASPDEDFSTGVIPYKVTLPAYTLGVSQETNPLGDDVSFFNWWYLVLFNEYKIPVKITASHNNQEFELDSEITVTQVKEVRWIIIAITIAVGAWLAIWGRKAFQTTEKPLKSGSFQKKLDSVRGSTIDRKNRGSFSKELQRQRDSDRNQIRKIKKKAKKK